MFDFELLHTDALSVIVTGDSRVSKRSNKEYFTGSGDVTARGPCLFHEVSVFKNRRIRQELHLIFTSGTLCQ